MKTISVIILAVCIIAFLLDVLNGLYEKEKEEIYLRFDFKQDVETQQTCYELTQQKQELDRLILERQIENRNNEIKERYKRCPNCGANLQYKNGIAKCKYCDSEWS